MEIGTNGRLERLIEAGVMAGCYWRQERLATHPSAKNGWAALALKRRAVGAAICGELTRTAIKAAGRSA